MRLGASLSFVKNGQTRPALGSRSKGRGSLHKLAQTRPTSLGSRLKKLLLYLRLAAALFSLALARLRAEREEYFADAHAAGENARSLKLFICA